MKEGFSHFFVDLGILFRSWLISLGIIQYRSPKLFFSKLDVSSKPVHQASRVSICCPPLIKGDGKSQ